MSVPVKILVVEDNDFVRMQIVKFLTAEQYDIIEAPDGKRALEIASEDSGIELAIVDVRMEPIDGFEFVRTSKGMGLNISVILVTGDHNPDLLNESAKWGISAVLMKPVQKDRLIKTVQRTIQNRMRNA